MARLSLLKIGAIFRGELCFKMKKIYLGILICMIFIPIVSAITYQINDEIDLKIPFEVNGSAASSTADCNISIIYPNNTYLAETQNMTDNNYGEFNYTIISSKNNVLGKHTWTAFCCDGVYCAAGYDRFEVTYSGGELSTANGIMYVIFLIIAFFVFILCMYGSFKIPWDNNKDDSGQVVSVNDFKWLKLFLMVFGYLTFIFIMAISYNITENFLFIDYASGFFYILYMGSLALFFPMIILLPWIVIYIVFQDRRVKQTIERGLPMR